VKLHWGFLLPQVSKKTGKPIMPKAVNNARDDKLRSSTFWRKSFVERRCLVPATAFCEAKGSKPATYYWFATEGEPLVFAGLWNRFNGLYREEQVSIDTFTIVTTTPNELVAPIHPTRMPVILPEDRWETWMAGSPDAAFQLIEPYPPDKMSIVASGKDLKSYDDVA
jgi:putative SOS response-associated peptidase YedK